jgi:hypothetical protein
MLDPKGSGAKGYARCGWHFVFNAWASITAVVDEFGWWWASSLLCAWSNIGIVLHVCTCAYFDDDKEQSYEGAG